MNQKNAVHHEDHEGFCELSYTVDIPANSDSWVWRFWVIHPKGGWHFGNNRLFFFASCVFFVVQMRFLG